MSDDASDDVLRTLIRGGRVPVTEAVIRSCKTRTRPIMITALALVAGSSVIFTDPIFQGMAISLASGVMVSTILTLVVIPLGCIKAERALCQVAAAGCAPGTPLPEAILAVTAPVRQAAAPGRKSSFSFSNLPFTVWELNRTQRLPGFRARRSPGRR